MSIPSDRIYGTLLTAVEALTDDDLDALASPLDGLVRIWDQVDGWAIHDHNVPADDLLAILVTTNGSGYAVTFCDYERVGIPEAGYWDNNEWAEYRANAELRRILLHMAINTLLIVAPDMPALKQRLLARAGTNPVAFEGRLVRSHLLATSPEEREQILFLNALADG